MASEGNKMNDGTSYQPSEPARCANGCGFFGSWATMNLCSKCYRDFQMKEEQTAAAKAAMENLVTPQKKSDDVSHVGSIAVKSSSSSAAEAVEKQGEAAAEAVKGSNRCLCCNKKVGVMGFSCRCGSTFCGVHRYPEKHDCTFDFRGHGRDAIAMSNPIVKGDKIQRF